MLDTLAQRILGAPFEADGWRQAVDDIGRATGSSRAQIIGFGGPANVAFNHISNLDDTRHYAEFMDIEGFSAAVSWRVTVAGGPGTVQHEHHYRSVRNQPRFGVYNDFAAKYDMEEGCQTVLASDATGFLGLATLRSRADGVSSERDIAVFTAIAPTVLKAIRVQQALEHQGALLLSGAMEAMHSAAYVLDSAGQVVAMTGAAEAHAGRQNVLGLQGKTLRARDRSSDARLQQGIGAILAGRPDAAGSFWLADPTDRHAGLACDLFALPAKGWTFGSAPRALVTVRPLRGATHNHARLLHQAFGLTTAEVQIVDMITRGIARQDIARARNVSLETVASQMKAIFAKMGVAREAELVALVAGSAAAADSAQR